MVVHVLIGSSLSLCRKQRYFKCSLSDHSSIHAIRKKSREKVNKVRKSVRNLTRYDKDVFNTLFLQIDWDEIFVCDDSDVLWETIHGKMIEILAVMCPYKNILCS